MKFDKRSTETEIMDDFTISGEVIGQTLRELDTINHLLGGNSISLGTVKQLLRRGNWDSLADLGCGSGEMLLLLNREAQHHGRTLQLFGVDANPFIADYARQHVGDSAEILCEDIFSETFRSRRFDVIHACLFLHHFTHEQLVGLFRQLATQASTAIVVNDLQRHWLAYYSIKVLTYLFSKSYMVRNDAAVSVSRGFTRGELECILREAGLPRYTLRWRWAFRWQLVVFFK